MEREVSRLNSAIDKVVVSDSLTPDQTAPWPNTHIVSRGDAHEKIAELKRGPGRDILVFGSHTLWNDLLAHDLVGSQSRCPGCHPGAVHLDRDEKNRAPAP